MTKTELIEQVAAKVGLSKAAAGQAVEAVIDEIIAAVAQGETVTLPGFGTFRANLRAARSGVNPATGAKIAIAARRAPAFSAGTRFKSEVNKE